MREALGTQARGRDFIVFYTAGRMVREGHYGDLYDRESIGDWIACVNRGLEDCVSYDQTGPGSKSTEFDRFLHPPALAVAFVPLSMLSTETAYRVLVAINLVAIFALWLVLDQLVGSNILYRVGILGALLTVEPLYASLLQGQIPILLTLLLSSSIYALLRREDQSAGALFGGLILKPQFLAFTFPALLFYSRRWIKAAVLVGLFGLAFFIPVGWSGIREFLELLRLRSELDSTDYLFAVHVISWPGFIAGVINDDPPRILSLFAQALTGIAFLATLRRRDQATLLLGCLLAALVIGPHSHHQDWLLVLPGVALLLRYPAPPRVRAVDLTLLVVLYLALNDWPRAFEALDLDNSGAATVYFATLAGAAVLAWLAVRPRTAFEEQPQAATTS